MTPGYPETYAGRGKRFFIGPPTYCQTRIAWDIMTSREQHREGDEEAKTARTVGQLVRYSREVNQSETVDEVATYALEGTVNLMDGHPSPTVVEIREGDLKVIETMSPDVQAGGDPSAIAERAADVGSTVIIPEDEATVSCSQDDAMVMDPADIDGAVDEEGVTIAVPSVSRDGIGVIIVARWPTLDSIREYHVKPLEYLADHVATAINNIRSRERLQRARNDLAKRKEMIEVYDRLLRHDLGNDLQVIAGFSEALVSKIDGDDQSVEYAEKIQRTAESAADLIDRVGDLVKTLEQEEEPEPKDLAPIVTGVVDSVDSKYDNLTVKFDPEDADVRVYAGDLLESIFSNILSNAAVHNDDEVTVDISIREPSPERVVVGFADDGRGVPAAVRDDLFEMGKKGPDSDGTGFGLGLARALTESYGGGIEYQESDRGGAAFRVTLDRV